MWICVCGQWIHNGYLLLEKLSVNGGIYALWYTKSICIPNKNGRQKDDKNKNHRFEFLFL